MKAKLIGALALSLAISSFGTSAFAAQTTAQPAAAHFRTAQAQTFSAADLQRYGLDAGAASKVEALQDKGYTVKVMSKEEAQQYTAGEWSTTTWIIVGAVVIVAIALAAD